MQWHIEYCMSPSIDASMQNDATSALVQAQALGAVIATHSKHSMSMCRDGRGQQPLLAKQQFLGCEQGP